MELIVFLLVFIGPSLCQTQDKFLESPKRNRSTSTIEPNNMKFTKSFNLKFDSSEFSSNLTKYMEKIDTEKMKKFNDFFNSMFRSSEFSSNSTEDIGKKAYEEKLTEIMIFSNIRFYSAPFAKLSIEDKKKELFKILYDDWIEEMMASLNLLFNSSEFSLLSTENKEKMIKNKIDEILSQYDKPNDLKIGFHEYFNIICSPGKEREEKRTHHGLHHVDKDKNSVNINANCSLTISENFQHDSDTDDYKYYIKAHDKIINSDNRNVWEHWHERIDNTLYCFYRLYDSITNKTLDSGKRRVSNFYEASIQFDINNGFSVTPSTTIMMIVLMIILMNMKIFNN